MRLWRMVCALCRELRRFWHEVTEATNFFRWISPKAVILSFPVWTPSHPLFCHVFVVFFLFFFGKFVDLWGEDGWEPRSFFSFFVDADAKTWGIPQEAGRGSICWLAYVTSTPIFFWKGSCNEKTPIDSKFKMLKFFDWKTLILFVWFFWWVESCTSNFIELRTQVLKKFYGEEMVFWGEEIPGCRKHPSRDLGKDSQPFIGFLNPWLVKWGEVA